MSSSVLLDTVSSDLARLRSLKAGGMITPREAEGFANRAASAFMKHYAANGEGLTDAVTILCEIATLPDEASASAGVAGLFPSIIEPLGDAFDPVACRVYNRLFAQVIQFCRALPEGETIDRKLKEFGLLAEQDLVDRAERIGTVRRRDLESAGVHKVLVFSRVTLGADVAVTSIVLEKMKRLFPRARIVLLANEGIRQLFGGDPRITVRPFGYSRGGGLMGRLVSWLDLVETTDQEISEVAQGECLIIDPDSRLTQLGLLPVVKDDAGYCFFQSRAYRSPGAETLGELTGRWLTEVFGGNDRLDPYVSPEPTEVGWARALADPLRRQGRYLVSVNLGVGENQLKRIPDPFEEELLRTLIAEGAAVILDRGAGEEELARSSALIGRLTALGHRSLDLKDVGVPQQLKPGDVITFEGGVGRLCALIAESHLYIGYDSAGQHLAAAVGTPSIDIFAGYSSPLMPARWRPYGRAAVSVVNVAPGNAVDPQKVLTEVLRQYRLHRRSELRK